MSIVNENFWFISKLIRIFYNNIKKYDFMFKVREKKNQKSKVKIY